MHVALEQSGIPAQPGLRFAQPRHLGISLRSTSGTNLVDNGDATYVEGCMRLSKSVAGVRPGGAKKHVPLLYGVIGPGFVRNWLKKRGLEKCAELLEARIRYITAKWHGWGEPGSQAVVLSGLEGEWKHRETQMNPARPTGNRKKV